MLIDEVKIVNTFSPKKSAAIVQCFKIDNSRKNNLFFTNIV